MMQQELPMRRHLTVRIGIVIVLSLLLLGFGGRLLFDGHRKAQEFKRWEAAKPVEGVVDFSAPGQFTFPFHQTCSSACSESVALHVPMEALQGITPEQLLDGIFVTMQISDQTGSNVVTVTNSSFFLEDMPLNGNIPIFKIPVIRKGDYNATVTIIRGAPALTGIAQSIEGRYELCGIERMPATIANTFGVASISVGIIIGFLVRSRSVNHRKNAP